MFFLYNLPNNIQYYDKFEDDHNIFLFVINKKCLVILNFISKIKKPLHYNLNINLYIEFIHINTTDMKRINNE